MQWFLQRLMGMCGAAGWPCFDLDDDDIEDDGVNYGYMNYTPWLIPDCADNKARSNKSVYEWIPNSLSPLGSGPDVAKEAAGATTGASTSNYKRNTKKYYGLYSWDEF